MMDYVFGLKKSKFDIEHAIVMYASGYCTLTAEHLYDKDLVRSLGPLVDECHIYIVGFVPGAVLVGFEDLGDKIGFKYDVGGNSYTVPYEIPEGFIFKADEVEGYLESQDGGRYSPDRGQLFVDLGKMVGGLNFEVKYIGKGYGKSGSRSAIDRLMKHEKLQEIAIKGVPAGQTLAILMLKVEPSTTLVTYMTPNSKNSDDGDTRIQAGLEKMKSTTEKEMVSIYEAALIRYFYPEYNFQLKDSFPSTDLGMLKDCYDKDICSVIAEISIDELPYNMFSEKIKPKQMHTASYYLNQDEDRKVFFGLGKPR